MLDRLRSAGAFAVVIASAICLLATPMLAAQDAIPAAYSGPELIDLSGTWSFKLDPAREGEARQWSTTPMPDATPLAVPGSFNEQLASNAGAPDTADKMRFYKGAGWYSTTFATPQDVAAKGLLCLLHLSGTVLRHKVWINGKLVGSGDRPYLEESYDITAALHPNATNTLVVEVDNTIPKLGIPDNYWHGWWDDGGLIRPVFLELRPAAHGETHVTTTMQKPGQWKLDLATELSQSAGASIAYELLDATGKRIWRRLPGSAATESAQLKDIHSWSPETPALYTLVTTIAANGQSDITRTRIGFRQIQVRGTTLLLNGAPINIHGLSRHQFLAGAGMSLSVAQDRADIVDLKALGANFVRLAHYTQSQDVYDLCDELGLLVWTEIPAWQSNAASLASDEVWQHDAQPQLQGMVAQHRNHPSVVVWSVANEIPSEKVQGAAYVSRAVAYVKQLDPSRLVTFASDRREGDQAFGPVDFIAINEYFGWYYGKPDDVGPMLDKMHRKFPDKPILVSEFGADGVAGWDPATAVAKSRDYSYAAEATFLQQHLEQIFARQRRSYVAGGVVWVYNDFPDPHRLGGDHPVSANFRNNKGVVTMDRTRKPAYAVVQAFFAKLTSSK